MTQTATDNVITPLTSRQRLADISHHFLSEEGERAAPWQKTRLIPLLLVCREDDYVAYLLKNALQRDKQQCTVLNIENQSGSNTFFASLKNNPQPAPDICLLPLTSPTSILAIPHDKLLMAVPTSLPGIRLAYHRLAQLAEQQSHITVHIIMLDAQDEQQSDRYFSFLRSSAKSLLSLDIKSVGALQQQSTDEQVFSNADNIVKNMLFDKGENAAPGLRSDSTRKYSQVALTSISG